MKQDSNKISRVYALSRDQLELIRIHERFNDVISIVDVKLLVAVGKFPKRLSTCPRPACATCFYVSAYRKPCRYKGHENKAILERMKHLTGETAHANVVMSSVLG